MSYAIKKDQQSPFLLSTNDWLRCIGIGPCSADAGDLRDAVGKILACDAFKLDFVDGGSSAGVLAL